MTDHTRGSYIPETSEIPLPPPCKHDDVDELVAELEEVEAELSEAFEARHRARCELVKREVTYEMVNYRQCDLLTRIGRCNNNKKEEERQ